MAPELLEHRDVQQAGLLGTINLCLAPQVTALEVPEPLWIRYWPKAVFLVLAVHAARRLQSLPRLTIVTYAIDNLPASQRLTLPRLDRLPLLNRMLARVLLSGVALTTLRTLDAIAYGTADAQSNYEKHFSPSAHGIATTLITEQLARCRVCFDEAGGRSPMPIHDRPKRVVFLGELSRRKGVDLLLNAWPRSTLRNSGWQLLVCGAGPLEPMVERSCAADASIHHLRPSRSGTHDLLASARAVILTSVTVPRWREQVGLSLLEGEAHGCCVLAPAESGVARALHQRSDAAVIEPCDQNSLVAALDRIPNMTPAVPPAIDSRLALREWFREVTEVQHAPPTNSAWPRA